MKVLKLEWVCAWVGLGGRVAVGVHCDSIIIEQNDLLDETKWLAKRCCRLKEHKHSGRWEQTSDSLAGLEFNVDD